MSQIDVETLVSDDASVAQVSVTFAGYHAAFTGSAKKHPNDPAVHTVGEALALARAFSRVAEDLEAYALETNARHVKAAKLIRELEREDYEL